MNQPILSHRALSSLTLCRFSRYFHNVPLISSTLPYSLNIKVGHLFCPIITKEFRTYSRTIVGGRSGSGKSKKLWVSVGLVRDQEAIGLKPKRMLWDSPDPLKKETPLYKGVGPTMLSPAGLQLMFILSKRELWSQDSGQILGWRSSCD